MIPNVISIALTDSDVPNLGKVLISITTSMILTDISWKNSDIAVGF